SLTRAPLEYGGVVTTLALLALWKHVPNMKRIMLGEEPKIGQKGQGKVQPNSVDSRAVTEK
ncbi:MAG TPA: hypothetical protein VF719_11915, partial [Abditibacteriaceae bacterium]